MFDYFRKVSVSVEYLVVRRMHDDPDRLGLCFWFRPTVAFRSDSELFFPENWAGDTWLFIEITPNYNCTTIFKFFFSTNQLLLSHRHGLDKLSVTNSVGRNNDRNFIWFLLTRFLELPNNTLRYHEISIFQWNHFRVATSNCGSILHRNNRISL